MIKRLSKCVREYKKDAFLTPFFIYAIEKKKFKLAVVLTITFLLSSSTQGIVVALCVWG